MPIKEAGRIGFLLAANVTKTLNEGRAKIGEIWLACASDILCLFLDFVNQRATAATRGRCVATVISFDICSG